MSHNATVSVSVASQVLWRENQAKSRVEDRSSKATVCLEAVWQRLGEQIHGLPGAVVLILHAHASRRGHFSPSTWKYVADRNVHEVAVNPNLFETPAELLATLVHEAAHAVLFEGNPARINHCGGCSRDGYYHRREFRDQCRLLGLECGFVNNRYGWCRTWWPEGGVPDRYSAILNLLTNSLPWGTGAQPIFRVRTRETPKSGHVKLVCKCSPPRRIYSTKSVLVKGGIRCECCNTNFN